MPGTHVKDILMHTPHPSAGHLSRCYQAGASLVEILVTLLILSFGLLGMSALQARALKGSVSSFQRSQAVIFSQYMLDVMRIDRQQAKSGDYNLTNMCSPSDIAGATLATNSLREWLTLVQSDVGTATGVQTCVTVKCDGDFQCSVSIIWDDKRVGGIGEQTITVSSRI
jgi:type IV pilus assembly protein PilV